MRSISTINNVKSILWGLNISEAYVFSWIYELPSWADNIIVKKEVFYYCSRNKVIDELPLISDKPDTIYRYIKSLEKKGLIKAKKMDNKDYVMITELGKSWNDSRVKSDNSEINPSILGNKSELFSDLNPTYNNIYSIINIDNITNDNFADFLKKSEKDLNSHLKQDFLAKYLKEFKTEAYFTAKEAGKLSSIIKKIIFKMKEKSAREFFTVDEIKSGISFFISTGWEVMSNYEKEKFSLTILDSNFNDIFVKIKNRSNGKPEQRTSTTNRATPKYNVPDPRTNNSGAAAF